MALSAATKARVRRDYEQSDLTLVAIGIKYDRSPSYISQLARKEGWALRSLRPGKRTRSRLPVSRALRAAIARRLCDVVNRKLEQMEKDMQSGALSSADLERDAKSIGAMIGGVQKVVPGPNEDKVSRPDDILPDGAAEASDIERLQREIVERFERIQRRRQAEGGSE